MTAARAKAEKFQIIQECAHVLPDAEDRLLRLILTHDSGGGCWVSVDTMAAECGGWSEAKVHRTLRALSSAQFILTEYGRGGSRAVRRVNWSSLIPHRRKYGAPGPVDPVASDRVNPSIDPVTSDRVNPVDPVKSAPLTLSNLQVDPVKNEHLTLSLVTPELSSTELLKATSKSNHKKNTARERANGDIFFPSLLENGYCKCGTAKPEPPSALLAFAPLCNRCGLQTRLQESVGGELDTVEDQFDRLWQIWPKGDRSTALKRFREARRDPDFDFQRVINHISHPAVQRQIGQAHWLHTYLKSRTWLQPIQHSAMMKGLIALELWKRR